MISRHTLKNLSLSAALSAYCLSASAAELQFNRQAFQFPIEAENLIVVDLDGDDLQELVTVTDNRLRIFFQTDTGFDFDAGFADIELPGQATGWDISSGYAADGTSTIIALVDGREAIFWSVRDNTVSTPQTIKADLPGFLSKGFNRLHFSRDINGDDLEDLIIPGAGVLQLLVNDGGGDYQSPLTVQSDIRIRSNLNSTSLERRSGQEISIPMMNLRDVNSDGSDDLVSRTEERLDVFIADATGERYFSTEPSYTLDIAAIEERLGEFDIDDVDFSNLTGLLALTHEEILEDVDGDGIDDLLLREGGKVSLITGTATGMDFEQPRQVLRSGGNVLGTFLYDENEDELNDLWLWRVESISVGDIFVWLALSGSIAVEAFVYPNDGERFSRRPTRKITVNLKFPSVLRLADAASDISAEAEASSAMETTPSSTANLDNDPSSQDLLVLLNQQLNIFLNSIAPDEEEPDFLGALDYSRERDNYEIDIREIIENISIGSNPHLSEADRRSPDLSIDLDVTVNGGDIVSALINDDAKEDLFVFTEYDGSHIQGILLLSE